MRITSICFLMAVCSCGITVHPPETPYTAAGLLAELDTAYVRSDSTRMARFFENWRTRFAPDNFKNDTLLAVEEIFAVLYKPHDLLALGQWEWGNTLNEGAPFVSVQDSIRYQVTPFDSLENASTDNAAYKVIAIRPRVAVGSDSVLYETSVYDSAINRFLGTESTKLGEGGIMNPSAAKGESEKRFRFLRPWLPVLHGHWGGYWNLETDPLIYRIDFNRQMTEAKAYFQVGYMGGEALLRRYGNIWMIVTSRATWIE